MADGVSPSRVAASPIMCLITDRRRLASPGEASLVRLVEEAARCGVDLVQIRERDLDGLPLVRLVRRCVEAVRSTGTRVVVNDRVDVALAAEAHGVHLRHDSMPVRRVRAIAPPEFLVGRSVHAVDEVTQNGADDEPDYLIVGTVFETSSKPGRMAAGVEGLARIAAVTRVPVLAVGGMTVARFPAVAAAGARGIAAIGLFADADRRDIASIVEQARVAFDSDRRVS